MAAYLFLSLTNQFYLIKLCLSHKPHTDMMCNMQYKRSILFTQENILHMCRPKLRFCAQHGVLCESCFLLLFAVYEEMKNKEYHHGRFQHQSPQHFFDRYKHMNNLRNCMILRLKPLQVVYFLIN